MTSECRKDSEERHDSGGIRRDLWRYDLAKEDSEGFAAAADIVLYSSAPTYEYVG